MRNPPSTSIPSTIYAWPGELFQSSTRPAEGPIAAGRSLALARSEGTPETPPKLSLLVAQHSSPEPMLGGHVLSQIPIAPDNQEDQEYLRTRRPCGCSQLDHRMCKMPTFPYSDGRCKRCKDTNRFCAPHRSREERKNFFLGVSYHILCPLVSNPIRIVGLMWR